MSSRSSYGMGYKPVAHQAPIVLTARLSRISPEQTDDEKRDMKKPCNRECQPGMLAFVEDRSVKFSVYPEPEYHTNVHKLDVDNFSFLGIVQTPGKTSGLDTFSGASDANVVHAGGTMTTFNTGGEIIPCNALVYYDFEAASHDSVPKAWRTYAGKECCFPKTLPVKMGNAGDYQDRIIGRAIRTSQPGQQLDLIMAQ